MKISFCTHVLNRWPQLQQVWDDNVATLAGTDHEWVIVDLGSTDGIAVPEHPNVRYIRLERPVEYSVARGKDAALRAGTGDYLFSLDADNYITPELVTTIIGLPDVAIWNGGGTGTGTNGRYGAPRAVWEALGYHPDWPEPYGIEDREMLERLAIIVPLHRSDCTRAPVRHARASTDYLDAAIVQTRRVLHSPAYVPSRAITLPALSLHRGWLGERRYPPQFCGRLEYHCEFDPDFDYGHAGVLPGVGYGRAHWRDTPAPDAGGSVRLGWRQDNLGIIYVHEHGPDWHSLPLTARPGAVYRVQYDGSARGTVHVVVEDDAGGRAKHTLRGPRLRANVILYHVFRTGTLPEHALARDSVVRIRGIHE